MSFADVFGITECVVQSADGCSNTTLAAIQTQMTTLATSPLITKTAEGTVQERTNKDMIEMDRHLSAKAAGSRPAYGLRIARIRPGGTVN